MRRLSALLFAAMAAPAGAEPMVLSDEALRQLATGKTVHLESPYGTLPVTFKDDGTLSAKASGPLALYLGSTSDRGRWSVKGDRICQKFFRWFSGETHCMRVKQDGRRITWRRDDGVTGTATIAANEAPRPERPVGLGVSPASMAVASDSPPPMVIEGAREPAAIEQGFIERTGHVADQLENQLTVSNATVGSQIESARVAQLPAHRATVGHLASASDANREPPQLISPITPVSREMVRPILASLHPVPKSLPQFGRSDETSKSVPGDPIVRPAQALPRAPGDVVEHVLRERVSNLWCKATLDNSTLAGMTMPFIFEAARLAAGVPVPGVGSTDGTGCLMPEPLLPELARIVMAGASR